MRRLGEHHRHGHRARRGNDLDEPIADAARSILDGHIVLSRELAARNHFPAIDVLNHDLEGYCQKRREGGG